MGTLGGVDFLIIYLLNSTWPGGECRSLCFFHRIFRLIAMVALKSMFISFPACAAFIAGVGCCLLFTQTLSHDRFPLSARRLTDTRKEFSESSGWFSLQNLGLPMGQIGEWAEEELSQALASIQTELQRRGGSQDSQQGSAKARFKYVHKHTYATGDPKAAAYFVASYFGGWCNHEPGHGKQRSHCNDTSFEQPITWNAYFPPSLEQPLGFSIHFVKNPHKLPAKAPMNETELGLLVEKWRGNLSQTGRFDQFMDNHLGLVFDSLDPLVEKWQRDGVPFICRSWCCGPGMEQWPDRCPFGPSSDSDFCEQGCYVEVPHGIILEALCGMENYKASRKCLTKVGPHQLKSFDLCSDN